MHVIYRSPVYTPLFLAGVCMLYVYRSYVACAWWRVRAACIAHSSSLALVRQQDRAASRQPPSLAGCSASWLATKGYVVYIYAWLAVCACVCV